MTKEDIIKVTNELLVQEFEVDSDLIKPEAELKTTLELDSLDFVDLVVAIKNKFGVKLEKKDFEGVNTFEDFYSLIENRL
ncbi:phosphopantetheine-binding protein [Apibacter raozihei]|uniref:phosphopantetheine-binding protein n=1 Tax=Apibacter TaxID=1778601 RepID=UPI000FE3BD54|nr:MULTISPECIES: phosphopantetheine-binding protein [Apibacter]